MTTPVDERASVHPKFADAATTEVPKKTIDTAAARERVKAAPPKREDRAPRAAPRAARPETSVPEIPYKPGMFKLPIAAVYEQSGNALSYVVYPVGQAMVAQAGACAEAWDEVAKNNPAVRRWLTNMTKTSAWGGLLVAHLPILMTTMMVFGPDSVRQRFGAVVSDSFEQTSKEDHPNTP